MLDESKLAESWVAEKLYFLCFITSEGFNIFQLTVWMDKAENEHNNQVEQKKR